MIAIPEYLRIPIAAVIILLFAILPVLGIYPPWKNWTGYKSLKTLAKSFPGSSTAFLLIESRLSGRYQGIPFVLRYYISNAGRFYSPNYDPQITVSLKFNVKSRMKIVVYSFGDTISSFGKQAIFLKEVENLPSGIDNLTLYSNRPFEALRFFNDEKRCEALRYFWINHWIKGLDSMTIGRGLIRASRSIREADVQPAFIREILDNMIALKIENI